MDQQAEDTGLAYIDSCDSLTLLMIHGFPFSSAMWEPQVEDLSSVVRVVAPDLRGHGRSEPVPGPYTMQMFADDCVGLLDYLAIYGPVVVCGLSMGGYVAFELFRQIPERIAGMILVSTRAGADTAVAKANRNRMIALAEAEGVAPIAEAMLPKLLSPHTLIHDAEVTEFTQEMMEATSVEGVVGALAAMRDRPDSTPMLSEIDVPTLIIHGADDHLIPAAEADAMYNNIPNSELLLIPNAAHMPNLEQMDEFNDAVTDFLFELTGEDGHHHH
jgi:pimeloyl-ACP methyl ester carboxylesterase